jgi:hypothetical protein
MKIPLLSRFDKDFMVVKHNVYKKAEMSLEYGFAIQNQIE